jgi:error-prone DNA polymerase
MTYAELQVTTHFSFLRGASSAEELFAQAAMLGIPALGVVDRNSLAGIVRAYEASKETGVRLVVGCRLDLVDGTSLLVYPTDRAAYSRLCRLLSVGKSRGGKGKCLLAWEDVVAWNEGLLAILLGDEADDELRTNLARLKAVFGGRAYMALIRRFAPNEHHRLVYGEQAAQAAKVPTVAMGDVLYHHPSRRRLQDVVSCIRQRCTIDEAGSGSIVMPTGSSRIRSRWRACSSATPRPSGGLARSSTAAGSASTSCATNTRARRNQARRRRRSSSA